MLRPTDGSKLKSTSKRRSSPHEHSSGDSTATSTVKNTHKRTSFTRSRSPAVLRAPTSLKSLNRHLPPTVVRNNPRQISDLAEHKYLLSPEFRLQLKIPLSSWTWTFSIDTRKLGESLLLLVSLFYATCCIAQYPTPEIPFLRSADTHVWLAFGNCECYSFGSMRVLIF